MNSSVYVYRKDGSPNKNAKVVLSFGGLFSGGITKPSFTDNSGCANIEHSAKGTAKVIVNGKKCGSFTAPGRTTVTY